VSAATYTISAGTPGIINATINNVASSGDTVILNPGTYFENNINVSKTITIEASGSQVNTFIDGNQANTGIFNVTGAYSLTLSGLTLRNGYNTLGGGAINSTGPVTVTSSTFTNCSAHRSGGAIVAYDGLTVTSSTFTNCLVTSPSGWGGAVDVEGGDMTLSSSTFTNCSGGYDGGAIYVSDGDLTVTSSTFTNCTNLNEDSYGGAIEGDGDFVNVTSSTFTNCASGNDGRGGAIEADEGNAVVTSTSITNCSIGDEVQDLDAGGAIYADDYAVVTSTSITNCSAGTDSYGGGIYAKEYVVVNSTSITNCSVGAGGSGGAVYAYGGSIQFSRLVNDNAGTAVVQGIYSPPPTNPQKTGHTATAPATSGVSTEPATLTATDNWWGSNANPSGEVSESVTYDPWLVLGIAANPTSIIINPIQTSAIQANLTFDSNGNYDNPATMHVPDGIPVTFGVSPGSIGHVLPLTGTTANGAAATTFTPANDGTATVSATVDGQQVTAVILISGVPPTTVPPGHHGQSVGGGQPPSGGSSGYTGPAPTQVISNPTLLPTVQPTVSSPVNASAAGTSTFTAPPLPTNTPRSGLDAVPVLGALGLCGVIFLFRKNGN
jgi:hypothetical protein